MLKKPCAICPIYEICAQAFNDTPCPVNGATEKDIEKYIYEGVKRHALSGQRCHRKDAVKCIYKED